MLPKKSVQFNNELPCHICGKLTEIYQLKVNADSNWICISCSEKSRSSLLRKNKVGSGSFIKDSSANYQDPTAKRQESMQIPSNSDLSRQNNRIPIVEKTVYKCTYCNFKSRQQDNTSMCPSCGRRGRLIRIPTASELIEDIKKHPFD